MKGGALARSPTTITLLSDPRLAPHYAVEQVVQAPLREAFLSVIPTRGCRLREAKWLVEVPTANKGQLLDSDPGQVDPAWSTSWEAPWRLPLRIAERGTEART